MRQDIGRRWLKALRSNDYAQGKNGLRDVDDKFCCLGVLCDLYFEEKGLEWADEITGDDRFYRIPGWGSDFLPKFVQEWAGMKTNDGELSSNEGVTTLSSMNDDGHSFGTIAEMIEENMDRL